MKGSDALRALMRQRRVGVLLSFLCGFQYLPFHGFSLLPIITHIFIGLLGLAKLLLGLRVFYYVVYCVVNCFYVPVPIPKLSVFVDESEAFDNFR